MNKKEKILFLLHFILLLLECIVVLDAFTDEGLRTLRFYTTDSNLLCGVASLLYLLFRLPVLNKGGKGVLSRYFQEKGGVVSPDRFLSLLRFLSTACLLVTFTVVLLVLAPENGYAHEFLLGKRVYSHLICPFLSFFLFLLEEGETPYKWVKSALFTTLLYAIPMILLNALGVVSGPYSFLKIREQSIGKTIFWIVVILSGNALLSFAALYIKKRLHRRGE